MLPSSHGNGAIWHHDKSPEAITSIRVSCKLSSLSDWQPEDSDQDLREKTLCDLQTREIGRVDDMLADTRD